MISSFYVQSSYSLLQSTLNLDELFVAAKKGGYDSICLTDHTHLYGLYQFLKKSKSYDIKPIVGLIINTKYLEDDIELIAYAKNDTDLHKLIQLSSLISLNETLTLTDLSEYLKDLVIAVPSIQNFIKKNQHQSDRILRLFYALKTITKDTYLGLSLQDESMNNFVSDLFEMLNKEGFHALPTHRITYLTEEDKTTHEVLRQIENISESNPLDLSFKNREELLSIYKSFSDVFETAEKLFKDTMYHYLDASFELPSYPNPQQVDNKTYLKALATVGLQKRLANQGIKHDKPYQERLLMELDVIDTMGYNDYFLIVYDFVKYAKTHDILVGPGRGSAAGSLVAYSLGITEVDPIQYDLLFERFLNIERRSMPDIDLDFPDTKRDQVIEYVKEKYGKNHVVTITTFGSFAEKSSIRDIARIMKLSQARTNAIIKGMEKNVLDETDYEAQNLLKVAKKIEGLPRHTGTHAAGVIISKEDLSYWVPLQMGPHNILQSQFEASDLEAFGFLKIDFLGLRNLTVIEDVLKQLNKPLKLASIPLDDEQTYKLLQQADVSGIFQLESNGMKRVLTKLKPEHFEDLVAVLALFRPGPLQFIDDFIERRHGKPYDSFDPSIDDILKPTYGIIVYQEQIMKIAQTFAGYSLAEADLLRRGISKKDKDILNKERETFINKAIKHGQSRELAERIYELIERFADYGFNRSHSVAYALLAYQMAYLKAHYYKQFMTVLLSSVASSQTLVQSYIEEVKTKGIKVQAPDVNISDDTFKVVNDVLIAPLSMIKGIGLATIDKIKSEREKEPFKSYADFKTRMKGIINEKTIEVLIHSGALDSFGLNHRTMFEKRDLNSTGYELFLDDYKEQIYEEFTFEELKQNEIDVLGFNLTYTYDPTIVKLNEKHQTEPIDENKNFIKCVVKIKDIKEILTKRNDKMAFLIINDGTISVSATLFPEVFAKFKPLLQEPYILIHARKDVKGYVVTSIEKA